MIQEDQAYYGEYAEGLERIEELVLEELNAITERIKERTGEVPVEHIRSRIKESASLQEKLIKKGAQTDVRSAMTELSDLVGLRIVTHFIGEVYEILEDIQSSRLWKVTEVKDYISDPKPNGYRSLHVILSLDLDRMGVELPGMKELQIEIQMRTIAMDCWASLEHEMKYKRTINNTDLIISELKRCADEMASTDLSMQTIRDLIRREG